MRRRSGSERTSRVGRRLYDGVIGDLRVALFLAYVVLLIWRTRREGETPADWWRYIALFAALSFALSIAERIRSWWNGRRVVQRYRAIDPEVRPELLRMLKGSVLTQPIAWQLEREGDAEIGGTVERFPFARGARVATRAGFIVALLLGLGLLFPLVVVPSAVSPPLAWSAWVLACICGALAAWARRRMKHLYSMLEISSFGITEVNGTTRRMLRWGSPLVLSARPHWRRLELRPHGARDFIALDFDRIGFYRALALVVRRGGFVELIEKLDKAEEKAKQPRVLR